MTVATQSSLLKLLEKAHTKRTVFPGSRVNLPSVDPLTRNAIAPLVGISTESTKARDRYSIPFGFISCSLTSGNIRSRGGLSICSSFPTYRSSVFSLKVTISTFSKRVGIQGFDLAGRIFAHKSYLFLKVTFNERKPLPTGVVIGDFNRILFFS